jgi:formate/nitrite transporter FocA (FNT family)
MTAGQQARAADPKTERAEEQQRGEAQPAKGTRLSAVEIHDNILEPAVEEMRRPAPSLLWSALSSGLVIGFSFLAGGYVRALTPDAYDQAASAAVYPLGFIFVIMARSMLFTENTIVPIMPLLNRRTMETFRRVLRLWGLLLLGNLVGAFAFAWVLARTPMVPASLHAPLLSLAEESTTGGFGLVCYQALFAGWLIALLTWLLASTHATGAQIVLTWLATAPIAAFGFRHSIAGAVEAFYRVAAGTASLGQALGGFVVPAVLGNAIGGVLLVALVNYGQVARERPPQPG